MDAQQYPFLDVLIPGNVTEEMEFSDDVFLPALEKVCDKLKPLYSRFKGGYLYHRSLLIRPLVSTPEVRSVFEWNKPELWKRLMPDNFPDLSDVFFFAEDLLGTQWGIKDDRIVYWDQESFENFEDFGATVDDWAKAILSDSETFTASPAAILWEREHGELPDGKRLMPFTPIYLGGDFDPYNLHAIDEFLNMGYRYEIAVQFTAADLNEGDSITYEFEDGVRVFDDGEKITFLPPKDAN